MTRKKNDYRIKLAAIFFSFNFSFFGNMSQPQNGTSVPQLPAQLPAFNDPQSVDAVVHDILNNQGCSSQCEWLQRQYMRLMDRELQIANRESEFNKKIATGNNSFGNGSY